MNTLEKACTSKWNALHRLLRNNKPQQLPVRKLVSIATHLKESTPSSHSQRKQLKYHILLENRCGQEITWSMNSNLRHQ